MVVGGVAGYISLAFHSLTIEPTHLLNHKPIPMIFSEPNGNARKRNIIPVVRDLFVETFQLRVNVIVIG